MPEANTPCWERDDPDHAAEQPVRAWCFGCNRGGDVIALTGFMVGVERFYDRMEHLERLSGIAGQMAS